MTWTHYRELLRVTDDKARNWYMNEAIREGWSSRTQDRNIASQYYYRLLQSQTKDSVHDEMEALTADFQHDKLEFIKNPVVAEFLGLSPNNAFAAPVYGAVAMTGTSGIFGTLYDTYPRCSFLWDNVEMLRNCRTPILFINWEGDPYFAAGATEKCANTAMNAGMILIPELQHGHLQGANIQEIFIFANNATVVR